MTRERRRVVAAAGAVLLMWAAPVRAHHSFATQYDAEKPVESSGRRNGRLAPRRRRLDEIEGRHRERPVARADRLALDSMRRTMADRRWPRAGCAAALLGLFVSSSWLNAQSAAPASGGPVDRALLEDRRTYERQWELWTRKVTGGN
jgi:hypothetical protein